MVVIYGIHSVSEALKSGARSFEYVGIARERHDQRVQRLIDDCRASGVQVRFLPREQLDRTANTNTHQGVIAVTSSKQYADVDTLLDQRHGEHSFLVVLDSVEDPHNLGALIRTADAFGAAVALSDGCADPTSPKALRASAGSIWRVPLGSWDDLSGTRIALEAHAGEPLGSLDLTGRVAFLLGAEREGLPAEVDRDLDAWIPIAGAESLNVAASGAIALYEWQRQQA